MRAFFAAVVMSILVPAGALAVVVVGDGPERRLEPRKIAKAIPASPVEVVSEDEQHVSAALTWAPGSSVFSPRSGGLVQQVLLGPGAVLESGTPVAIVDGVTMIGYVAPQPLYRALGPGAEGADVSGAEDLLVGLGHLPRDQNRTRVDALLVGGFRRLNAQLGRTSDVLDPDVLVWAGVAPRPVAKVLLNAGSQFPGLGEPIAEGSMRLAALTLTDENGQPRALTGLAQHVLVVDDQELALDGTSLVPESAERLLALKPEAPQQVNAVVRLAEPVRLLAVPAGAVVVDGDGTACVVAMDGEKAGVDLVDGEPGRAYIKPSSEREAIPDTVIANPHDAAPGVRCAS